MGKAKRPGNPLLYWWEHSLQNNPFKEYLTQSNKVRGQHVLWSSNSFLGTFPIEMLAHVYKNMKYCAPYLWLWNTGKTECSSIGQGMNNLWPIYVKVLYRTEKETRATCINMDRSRNRTMSGKSKLQSTVQSESRKPCESTYKFHSKTTYDY